MTTNRVLVVFHSSEGQSERVATRIAAVLRQSGDTVEVATADAAPAPAGYTGVIAGDAIHYQRHSRELVDWLTEHRDALAGMPSGLFQLSLVSAVPRHADEAHHFVEALREATGYEPDVVGEFGGRLAYTSYGCLTTALMLIPAIGMGLSRDVTTDAEYTDWDAVEAFARRFHALLPEPARSS